MVNDFFKGFLYTLGKIIAFIFIGLVIGTLLTKIKPDDIKVQRLPFKQILMNLFFVNGHALTVDNVATVGRQQFMYTNNTYFNTGWKNLTLNSSNNSFMTANSSFYMMGSEYVNAITWTGDTSCTGRVEIPVASGEFSSFSNTDSLGISDFKFGIDPSFGVYNLNPSVTSFSHKCNTFAGGTYPILYCNYILNFRISDINISNGNTNINFAIYNNTSSRSAFYISLGGSANFNAFFPTYTNGGSSNAFYNLYPRVLLSCSSSSSVDTTIIENNQQTIINQNDTIINGINDMQNTILDDTHQNPQWFFDDMHDLMISDTPISDLISLPGDLFLKFKTGISGECSTISLGTWLDHPISIPCISLSRYLGSNLVNIIDILMSGFMIFHIIELLIYDFNNFISLNDIFYEVFTPNQSKKRG